MALQASSIGLDSMDVFIKWRYRMAPMIDDLGFGAGKSGLHGREAL
jgi:hypothetical protein